MPWKQSNYERKEGWKQYNYKGEKNVETYKAILDLALSHLSSLIFYHFLSHFLSGFHQRMAAMNTQSAKRSSLQRVLKQTSESSVHGTCIKDRSDCPSLPQNQFICLFKRPGKQYSKMKIQMSYFSLD